MTQYEKNIQTLSKYYEGMDRLIKDAAEQMEPDIEIIEETSEDEKRILKIKKDNRTCYLGGKRSCMEPIQMWIHLLGDLQRNAPVLLMGTGNPYYLEELVNYAEKRITIIVYEPSLQIFLKFLEWVDLEPWMEKHLIIFWVEGLQKMGVDKMEGIIGRVLSYEMLRFSRFLILPNYNILFADKAVEYAKICRNIALANLSQHNTKSVFSPVMVKNLLYNAMYLYKGYKTTQLVDVIPRDLPGIVVAAGPSLNKNIKELKKAKGKSFIVAVDSAIKPLLKEGIVPDMFAVIDALKPVELVKIAGAENIPLLTTLNAAPEVLEFHTGIKVFYHEGYRFAERILDKADRGYGTVSCGGSVATTAFSLLYKLGISTVILVGQDLAYTNNKSHADGTFHETMEEEDTSRFPTVEGNYEEKVPTRNDFRIFLEWYNQYIEVCKKYSKQYGVDFRVINATEGGAKIKGTEIMTLREAIEETCGREECIQSCLEKLSPMLSGENQKWAEDYLKNMPREFHKLITDANRIKKLYEKLDKICRRRNIDQKEYLNLLQKLEKQIKKIEKTDMYQLVSITMSNAGDILRGEQFLSEDTFQAEGQEIARKGILFMENVVKMAVVFEEYAEETFQNLGSDDNGAEEVV